MYIFFFSSISRFLELAFHLEQCASNISEILVLRNLKQYLVYLNLQELYSLNHI